MNFKTNFTFFSFLLAIIGWSNGTTAQALFKDLHPGTSGSSIEQHKTVNGTMYFCTVAGNVHELWKSDGTVAGTVVVADTVITTTVGQALKIRESYNDTLYYTVNVAGPSAGYTTILWRTHGTTPVLVDTLHHPGYPGIGGGYPTGFTMVGNKLFFSMWNLNGRELWVSDGTEAGTKEVIDLSPGSNGGTTNNPMIAFNGKVFFQGSATLGINELYSSDGTAAGTTLVKAGVYNPEHFIIYNNELYFRANDGVIDGLWKTDGTALGTVNVTNTGFNVAKIFQNEMYYNMSGTLWKSDGTTAGTMMLKDSVGEITGMNSSRIFTAYMKSLPVAPYFTMYYWKSDGTTAGTVRVSDSLGKAASFCVVNDKMYYSVANPTGFTSNLWETDGTEAGTRKIVKNSYLNYPYAFNNTVFFTKHTSATGYELWSFSPLVAPTNLQLTPQFVQVAGQMMLNWDDNSNNEDGFLIERSLDGSNWSVVGNTTSANYTDIGLANSTLYYYQVAAYNTSDTAYSNITSGTTLATGISTLANEASIFVFPNPASDVLTVSLPVSNHPAQLTIFNNIGQAVLSQQICDNQTIINISELVDGVYFVKMEDGTKYYTQKIIVQQ